MFNTQDGATMANVAAVIASGSHHWMVSQEDLSPVDLESMDDAEGPKTNLNAEKRCVSVPSVLLTPAAGYV